MITVASCLSGRTVHARAKALSQTWVIATHSSTNETALR